MTVKYQTDTDTILALILDARARLPEVTLRDPNTNKITGKGFLTKIDNGLRRAILCSVHYPEALLLKEALDELEQNMQMYEFYNNIGLNENEKALSALVYASGPVETLEGPVSELVSTYLAIDKLNNSLENSGDLSKEIRYQMLSDKYEVLFPKIQGLWKDIGVLVQLSLGRDDTEESLLPGTLSDYVPIWVRDRYVF